MVNHFEFHNEITNKANMVNNMFNYFTSIKRNVFFNIPYSINFDLNDIEDVCLKLNKFERILNVLDSIKYQFKNDITKNFHADYNIENENILNKYNQDIPDFNIKFMPLKNYLVHKEPLQFFLFFPHSFFTGNNIWIFKPSSLNRGAGIQLFTSFAELKRILLSKFPSRFYNDNEETASKYLIIIDKICL